jgi:hypothetical protein
MGDDVLIDQADRIFFREKCTLPEGDVFSANGIS